MRFVSRLSAAALLANTLAFGVGRNTHAQNVVDVSQSGGNDGVWVFQQTIQQFHSWALQTFVPTNAVITGAGTFWYNWMIQGQQPPENPFSQTGSVRIALWSNDPGTVGSSPLVQADVPWNLAANTGAWLDAFWSPLSVTVGNTYWLGILGNQTSAFGGPTFTDRLADAYVGGKAYTLENSQLSAGISSRSYDDQNSKYDLQFRTWTAAAVTPVPEPTTVDMAVIGLVMIAGVLFVRRRAEQ